MLKTHYYGAIILGIALSNNALAVCNNGNQITANSTPSLFNTLNGNKVCVTIPANNASQEQHRTDGTLYDYKRGPGHPIDPTEQVGNWSVNPGSGQDSNRVIYNYLGGDSFNFTLHLQTNGTYDFCTSKNGTTVVNATIETGATGNCSAFPP